MPNWQLAGIIIAGIALAIILERITAAIWPPTGIYPGC
jgi:hypothetical protein